MWEFLKSLRLCPTRVRPYQSSLCLLVQNMSTQTHVTAMMFHLCQSPKPIELPGLGLEPPEMQTKINIFLFHNVVCKVFHYPGSKKINKQANQHNKYNDCDINF